MSCCWAEVGTYVCIVIGRTVCLNKFLFVWILLHVLLYFYNTALLNLDTGLRVWIRRKIVEYLEELTVFFFSIVWWHWFGRCLEPAPRTCRKTSYIHVLDRYVSSFPVISKCRGIRFAVISRKLHKWNFLRLCLGLQNWITKGANLEIKGKVEIKMCWKVYMIIVKIGK
jgi:hypothetical protein